MKFFEYWLAKIKGWLGIPPKNKESVPENNANPDTHKSASEVNPLSQMSVSPTIKSYHNLKQQGGTEGQPGFTGLDHYPFKEGLNFQALEFPELAAGRKAWMLGNNQAFFFVKNTNAKGEANPDKITLDTGNLRKLIKNIYDHNTQFTLMVDGDVLLNKERFVGKYAHLRQEPTDAERRALLGREADLISEFVNGGGIRELVRDVLRESNQGKEPAENDVETFLTKNFRFEGLRLDEPLKAAVWEVEGPKGALCAKQIYQDGTPHTERPWQIGTQPELLAWKHEGHEGAEAVTAAVQDMHFQRLLTAYKDIKDPIEESQTAGYRASSGYPDAFQANLFPLLAKNGEVKMLGANQAFYFTHTNRDSRVPVDERVTLDTSKLEELMENVYRNDTNFTLMLDSDAMHKAGHGNFARKYLPLRPEPEEEKTIMQRRECEIITRFMENGGLQVLARKLIQRENRGSLPRDIDEKVSTFLKEKFHVVGVISPEAMTGAVWDMDGPNGRLSAVQHYSPNTQNTHRAWELGTQPELEQLKAENIGAARITSMVEKIPVPETTEHQAQVRKRGGMSEGR